MSTAYIYHDRFLQHRTGAGHPERPDRLRAVCAAMESADLLERIEPLPFLTAERTDIELVHDSAYIDRILEFCRDGAPFIDSPDSAICPESADIALLAVGGVLTAVNAVMDCTVRNAFCAVRPPGHHAECDRSMGFCLFNNVAIAASHLIERHDLLRIAIVDFDVHHGNGTQHLFEDRADVLFISLHEDPRVQYPGTGFADEIGHGVGKGLTLNIPLPPGSGDDDYKRAFDEQVLPKLDEYRPQFVLVSAGFDAAATDPLGHMKVSAEGFEMMSQKMVEAAGRHCNDRLVAVLEGGYDLDALGEGVVRCVGTFLG